jgi:RNA polymerase sigma factor (sigma-70 family)
MFQPGEVEVADVAEGPAPGLRAVSTAADPGGFDGLYRAEWPAIVALGWSLTGSWATAEELAQDAFVDAYRRWDEVGRLDRPGAWVRRAVINRSASVHRHRAVERRGLARWSSRGQVDADVRSSDRTGSAATDRVGDPAFWAAVRALPERQMACVTLHYLEDRSVAEIAEVLDCKAATVKVHLHRARQSLAERLGALEPGASGAPDAPDTPAEPPADGDHAAWARPEPARPTPDRGEEDR